MAASRSVRTNKKGQQVVTRTRKDGSTVTRKVTRKFKLAKMVSALKLVKLKRTTAGGDDH